MKKSSTTAVLKGISKDLLEELQRINNPHFNLKLHDTPSVDYHDSENEQNIEMNLRITKKHKKSHRTKPGKNSKIKE